MKIKFINEEQLKNEVKELIFDLAPDKNNIEIIKDILSNPENIFDINSKDKTDRSLIDYFINVPEMQKFLLEKGVIIAQKDIFNIAKNSCSNETTAKVV